MRSSNIRKSGRSALSGSCWLPRSKIENGSRLRYRGGVDTFLNALTADTDLFSAELNLAQSRRDELLSLVQLYKALGGGWQE
jgi:hypothetical protein